MGKYAVEPNGRIIEEGKPIGWISNNVIELDEGVKISVAAMNYLKAQAFDRIQAQPQGKPLVEVTQVTQEEHTHEAMRPRLTEISPAPPQDPRLGDKTPAYRRWYRMNHSQDEYEKKYGGRKVSDEPGPLFGGGDIPEAQTWKDNPEVWFKKSR